MKKIITLILAAVMLLVLASCGQTQTPSTANESKTASSAESVVPAQTADSESGDTSSEKPNQTESQGTPSEETKPAESQTDPSEETAPVKNRKDVLVIVFSATGTTKGVAEKIAKITDADIYEIKAAQPYSSADLNWNDRNSRTTIEMNDPNARPEIGSEDISLDGYKTVYIGYPIWWGYAPRIMSTFVESHSFDGMTVIPFCTSSSSGIGRSGSNLASQAKSGNWLDGRCFSGSVSESELRSWIEGLN